MLLSEIPAIYVIRAGERYYPSREGGFQGTPYIDEAEAIKEAEALMKKRMYPDDPEDDYPEFNWVRVHKITATGIETIWEDDQ